MKVIRSIFVTVNLLLLAVVIAGWIVSYFRMPYVTVSSSSVEFCRGHVVVMTGLRGGSVFTAGLGGPPISPADGVFSLEMLGVMLVDQGGAGFFTRTISLGSATVRIFVFPCWLLALLSAAGAFLLWWRNLKQQRAARRLAAAFPVDPNADPPPP
jgi:hypothetical protein